MRSDRFKVTILNQPHTNDDFVSRITDEFGSDRRVGPEHVAVCLQFQAVNLVVGAPGRDGSDHEVGCDQKVVPLALEKEGTRNTGGDDLEHAYVLLHERTN